MENWEAGNVFHSSEYLWGPTFFILFSSVQFSHLQPHGLQHTRPPCSLPTPGVYSNSHPLNWWCHPTISSSVIPISSCFQSFPASGSFPVSQFFTSGGQNIGASATASVLPMNIQGWFPLGWTGLRVQGTLKCLLQHHHSKASILWHSAFFLVQLTHPYITTGKTIALSRWPLSAMFLLFNMLSKLVIAFLPRRKHDLILWLKSSAMKQKFFWTLAFSMIQWMLTIWSLVPLLF